MFRHGRAPGMLGFLAGSLATAGGIFQQRRGALEISADEPYFMTELAIFFARRLGVLGKMRNL
jgi:hypothetical protein